jgi:hypothetical protein
MPEVNHSTIHHQDAVQGDRSHGYDRDCLLPDDRLRNKSRGTLRGRLAITFWRTMLGGFPRLHGIAMELRSLGWRSEFQSRLHQRLLSVEFGPHAEISPTGHLVPCRRTHARIADTESFESICPKATLFETWVFLQGWNMGERYRALREDASCDPGGETGAEHQP